jgi:putative ABC transport system permease protein
VNGIALAWRLARRELRAGIRGFRIFIACLTLGVAAIAAVGSLSEAFVAGLKADGRTLLGGDVDLRLHHHAPSDAQMAYLRTTTQALSQTINMRAMAHAAGGGEGRTLAELKAVDGAYPLVGALRLDPSVPLKEALEQKDGAWGAVVDKSLARRLAASLGGPVRIGDAVFQIRAFITEEPDRVASIVRFAPRVMVSAASLPDTGLVQPGSQIRYHTRITLAPGTDGKAWIAAVEETFPDAGWRIRGTDRAAPGVRIFIERLTTFLTFVGLTVLLVGGIGVGNAVKSYLDGKSATIAMLKCVGAPGGLVFRIYLLQVLALGLVGIVLGLIIGSAAPLAVELIQDRLPIAPRIDLYAAPLLRAVAFGLVTAVTFALWPLARAREVPAAALFRVLVEPPRRRPRKRYLAAIVMGVLLLAALTVVGTEERRFAYWFAGGSLVALVALRFGAALLTSLAARLRQGRRGELRLALTNIVRPGAPTASVIVSVGLGLSVLVAVALIEGNMSRQVNERLPDKAPALFFIDIQPHQVEAFDALVKSVPGTGGLERQPSLRGRIVQINGVPVEKVKIPSENSWAIRGDRALTYSAGPWKGARIVAGEWWPADYRGEPLISFDAGLARGFGVGIGDTLTLNILGRDVTARIASLREIDWRSLRFDFAIIFAPGVLDGAPQTHISVVYATPAAEEAVEKAVTGRFANVSAIRVREVLEAASRILDGVGTAVRAIAAITILSGALVLAGSVAAGQRRRIYDSIVFKVLGATRGGVLKAFLLEYGLLGLFTALIAAVVGSLTAWAVITHIMRAEWIFLPHVLAATLVPCVLLTIFVGFVGTWRVMGQKAAPHLRNE